MMSFPNAPVYIGEAPMYDEFADAGMYAPTTPVSPNKKAVIDYSKFKTKMCRNYLMGIPCPFEARCAFAHGDPQLRATESVHTQRSLGDLPPPSYSSFLQSSTVPSCDESPECSRPNTPPAYPTRFRYEPYSQSGIIFAA